MNAGHGAGSRSGGAALASIACAGLAACAWLGPDRPAWKVEPVLDVRHALPSAEAEYLMGRYFDGSRRWEAAIASYRRALARDPRHAESLNALGADLARLGRLEEAEAALLAAVECAPGQSHILNNLGYVRLLRHHAEDAVATLRQAVAAEPGNGMARQHLAWALSEVQAPAAHADGGASRPAGDAVAAPAGGLVLVTATTEGSQNRVAPLVAPSVARAAPPRGLQAETVPGASPMAPVQVRPDLAMVAPVAQRPELVLTAPVVPRPERSVVAPVSVPPQAALVALGLEAAATPVTGLSTRAILGLEPEAVRPPPPADRLPTGAPEKVVSADEIRAARIVLGLDTVPAAPPARLVLSTGASRNAADSRLPGAGG